MNRLPLYYNFLLEKKRERVQTISSSVIAKSLKLNNVQVRKDLASISSVHGKPRVGFDVNIIIKDLERILGCKKLNDVVLVGVGKLGRTLLSYNGFNNYSLNIVAGFDRKKELVGTMINGKPVMSIKSLGEFISKNDIKIGIITVAAASAQKMCDLLVKAGIKAIWNFAPVHLEIPDDVIIKHENLAASLALLTQRFENQQKKENNLTTK